MWRYILGSAPCTKKEEDLQSEMQWYFGPQPRFTEMRPMRNRELKVISLRRRKDSIFVVEHVKIRLSGLEVSQRFSHRLTTMAGANIVNEPLGITAKNVRPVAMMNMNRCWTSITGTGTASTTRLRICKFYAFGIMRGSLE